MVSDINYWSKVAKRIFSLALTVLLLYIIMKLSIFYLPFLIAFVLALFIEPAIKFLMKKLKWTRHVSAIFVITLSIILIVGIMGWGISTIFNEANNLLSGSGEYYDKAKKLLDGIFNNKTLLDKLPEELKLSLQNAEGDLIHTATEWVTNTLVGIKTWISKVPNLFMTFFFSLMSLFFMCTDKIYMIDQLEHHLPVIWTKKLAKHLHEITKSLGHYLRAEGTLILISFLISLTGLTIYNIIGLPVKYPLLSAIGIGFVDALPILGSGTVMAPWAVIEALNGNVVLGVAIIGLWAVMGTARNILEPRLVSKHIGIHPVFTLIAMYTGYKITGVMGMILGPILLIILKEIYNPLIEKGVLRSIFDRND